MELTAAQRRIVEHDGGPLRISGVAGSGKTTALIRRYLRLVREGNRPSSVLVVCRDRAAATRFRDAVLPELAGGFDALPFTTWFGVAFDVVTRARGPVQLVSSGEQRGIVRRLLADEEPEGWPVFGRYLGREAFTGEVARALLDVPVGSWPELDRFRERYVTVLDERGQVDRSMLLRAAFELADPERYAHVLVDDHEGDSPLLERYVDAAVVTDAGLPWPAAEVELTETFRHPADPVLVRCPHRSTEPEAVAGELLRARAHGVAWSDMAVLVRRPHRHGRAIARALGRHDIPVRPGPGLSSGDADPAVAAIVDVLRWSTGDEEAHRRLLLSPIPVDVVDDLHAEVTAQASTVTPAELAFMVWERGLGHLVSGASADDASLDAVVAFLDGLERRTDRDPSERLRDLVASLDDGRVDPDAWRASTAAADRDAVTITSIYAATGREWHTVVVAGCVEGELPDVRRRVSLFDAAPLPAAERRRAWLERERHLFRTACTRATAQVVATAAPEPGVLLSRFVEDWPTRDPEPLVFRGPAPRVREVTENPVGVFPDGRLRLSASQLDTYDDCPLRYAYQYGLRVRDDAGAPAALGSLVHEVLAEFLRPDRPGERTKEALLTLAADHWRDDIARYRPQVEECRRDFYAMLEGWWEAEGGANPPEVLKTEHEFDIGVGDLRLVGAIDRVDRALEGDGIRIVDYKTGRKEPSPDDLPDDLQLAVYHLAASRDPELAALGPPRQLQLLYLRSMSAYEQPILAGHAEATEARVMAVAGNIRGERFEPSVDASCRSCAFHRLCPLQREGREVGAP